MSTVGIRELRQSASQVMRRVQAGETVEVTMQGRPAARIVPLGQSRARTVTGAQLRQRMAEAVGLLSAEREAWADDIAAMPDGEDFADPWSGR
ncbi:MAG: type II toxin-antitoxin system prevent-host-death family antitoxin [Micrococcales bacterium]|nr:type II toxin-antitoxin system prevent-host-death family antitoxin [Micrococcales bacterium]